MRFKLAALFSVFLASGLAAGNATAQGAAYRFDKVADGVYLAVPSAANASNVPVIVSDQDAVLVASHLTPAAARALIDQLKTITDKPVHYIITTHYHPPQASAPRESYPAGIEVIGHELARRAVLTDAAGKSRPVAGLAPPTLGMTTRLAMYRGDREIRVLYLGRGHSDNDLLVLLPKEHLLCTGELLTDKLPDMGDANATEWVSTLEAMKALDFERILPARGAPIAGKARLSAYQSYLRDVVSQVTTVVNLNKDMAAEDVAKRVNLTSHQKDFPEITGPGVDAAAVRRLKTQIEEDPPFEP